MSSRNFKVDRAGATAELDFPHDEKRHQRLRRRQLVLIFLGLFALCVALEAYSRAVEPEEVFSDLREAFGALVDPEAALPSLDYSTNAWAIVAILRNVIPSLIMFWLVIWLGARFLQGVYGLSSVREGRNYLLTSLFGKLVGSGPMVVVSKGKVLGGTRQPSVRVGGPGAIVVHNDSAVLLEQAGRLSRVVGPGLHPLRRFEKVRDIIDLRPCWHPLTVDGMSREGIPVKCTVDVHYQINDAGRGAQPATRERPYAYSEEAVFRAATDTWLREFDPVDRSDHSHWGERVARGEAEGTLRSILARYPLNRLVQPASEAFEAEGGFGEARILPLRREIQEELKIALTNNAARHGAKILEVALRNIEVEDSVTQKWVESWQAEWQRRSRGELAEARAMRERRLARVKAEAQREMILSIMDGLQQLAEDGRPVSPNLVVMRFLETLQHVAGDPRSYPLLPQTHQVIRTLNLLRDMLE